MAEHIDLTFDLEEAPQLINTVAAFRAGQTPTADEINNYINLLISQGDYNTNWLVLIGEAFPTFQTAINALSDELIAEVNTMLTTGTSSATTAAIALINSAKDTAIDSVDTAVDNALGGWKRYETLADIDASLSLSTSTMIEIAAEMDNYTTFCEVITTAQAEANTDLPNDVSGVLEITRYQIVDSAGRVSYKYTDTNGDMFYSLQGFTTIAARTTWEKVVTQNDIGTTYEFEIENDGTTNDWTDNTTYFSYNITIPAIFAHLTSDKVVQACVMSASLTVPTDDEKADDALINGAFVDVSEGKLYIYASAEMSDTRTISVWL